MTHKYRGCIVVLSINKSVEPNEEQKVLTSSFDQGIIIAASGPILFIAKDKPVDLLMMAKCS